MNKNIITILFVLSPCTNSFNQPLRSSSNTNKENNYAEKINSLPHEKSFSEFFYKNRERKIILSDSAKTAFLKKHNNESSHIYAQGQKKTLRIKGTLFNWMPAVAGKKVFPAKAGTQ